MKTEELRSTIVKVLDRSGFEYSGVQVGQSFDVIARRDEDLLLLRMLPPRGDLDRSSACELRMLARVLKASPLIVVPSAREGRYQDGVLYIKQGIPVITSQTMYEHLIEGIPPLVFFGPGGHYVSVDGQLLRSTREGSGLSLGALAEMVGVSRRAIQMYETGMGADIDVAMRLESVLDVTLVRPLDPFSFSGELEVIRDQFEGVQGLKKDVFDHLNSMGLEIIPTMACPFDALARDRSSVLMTSVETDPWKVRDRSRVLSEVSRITGNSSFMIVSDKVQKRSLHGTALIRVSELKRTDHPEKLIRIIEERER